MKTIRPRRKTGSKQRLLGAACELFAERGFEGTHLREICRRAGANIAAVHYHFHGKEQLYKAVAAEASRRLSLVFKCNALRDGNFTPQEHLEATIQSLVASLDGDSRWIAILAVREALEPVGSLRASVSEGLKPHQLALHKTIHSVLGAQADRNTVRLHTLSALTLCAFYVQPAAPSRELRPGWDRRD